MNDFLVNYGLSQAYGETWVVVPQPQSDEIIAYCTVSPDPVELGGEEVDDIEAEVIQLERLAVDANHQKQGIGKNLLLRLIVQTFELSTTVDVEALNLFALDAEAKEWYLNLDFGFQELSPGSKNLTLPLSTIRLLLSSENPANHT